MRHRLVCSTHRARLLLENWKVLEGKSRRGYCGEVLESSEFVMDHHLINSIQIDKGLSNFGAWPQKSSDTLRRDFLPSFSFPLPHTELKSAQLHCSALGPSFLCPVCQA